MNFPRNISPWAIVLACVTGLCCASPTPGDFGEAPPEILLEGVGFKFFRENELRAVGKATQATFMRDTADGSAQSVRMRFLATTDRSEVELTAHEVHGNIRTQQAEATGGVRIAEAGGAIGTTESAKLDGPARRVTGEKPVDIVGAGFRVHGDNGLLMSIAEPGSLALKGPTDTILGGLR